MPTRVLLLRHAETANPLVFHGAESDVGLSERGQRQADAVAPVLAALKPTRIVCSAMRRARDTATPIARACGLNVRIEPDLHERRVGAMSGTPTNGGVWPATVKRWIAGDTGYAPPGAESFDDIRARVVPVWDRLATEYDGETYVVVVHGVVIRVLLLSVLAGYSVADWQRIVHTRNVGINELVRTPDGWQALRMDDVPPEVAALREERKPS